MSLIVSCSKCSKKYKVSDDKAGKKIKCAGCGSIISIEGLAAPQPINEGEVDLWDLPPAEDARKMRLPDLPPRNTPRKNAPKPSRSPRSKSSGPSLLKVLLIVFGAIGGISVLACGGYLLVGYNARTAARNDALANLANLPWSKYADNEAGFEADFPSQNVTVEPKPGGRNYSVVLPIVDAAFRVSYLTLRENALTLEKMKRASDDTIRGTNGTLTSRRDITIGGHSAIQTEYSKKSAGKTLVFTDRDVFVKDRVYSQSVIRYSDTDLTKESERFFNSFRFLAGGPTEAAPPTATPPAEPTPPAAPAVAWTKHADGAAGFEAEFPDQNVAVQPFQNGKRYHANIGGKDAPFQVTYNDTGHNFPTVEAKRDELKRVRDVLLSKQNGQLLSSTDISFGEHPGIRFEYKLTAAGRNGTVSIQYTVVKDRLFQQVVARDSAMNLTAEVERFFKSFRLLDGQ